MRALTEPNTQNCRSLTTDQRLRQSSGLLLALIIMLIAAGALLFLPPVH